MATKDNCLLSKHKQISDVNGCFDIGVYDSQYSNLSLNQNHKSSFIIPVHSSSKTNKDKHYDSTAFKNYEGKGKVKACNKSSDLLSNTLNLSGDIKEKDEKQWKKNENSLNISKSTLSLRIAVFENSIVGVASDFTIKKWENKKEVLIDTTFVIQNPFEFPRQQNDKVVEPEVSQFRASQQPLILVEASTNGHQNVSSLQQHQQLSQQIAQHQPLQSALGMQQVPIQIANPASMEQEENWQEAYKSIEHHASRPSQEDFQHLVDICNENGISLHSENFPKLVPPILIRFFSFFDQCEENTFEPMVMQFAEKCLLENPNCIYPTDLQLIVTYYCRRCNKGVRNVIRPALSFLRNLISKVVIPDNVIPIIITAMSILCPQELYFTGALNVMKLIFEHHYGYEAIMVLQKLMATDLPEELLTDISTYTTTAMAKGAVDLYTMLFWGPDRIKNMEMPLTPMLPYLLKATESNPHVCKEVLKSLSLIVVKHGDELDASSWETILKLLFKVSETEDVLEEEDIIKRFDYIIAHISKIVTHGNFRGSVEHYFDLVDATAKLQADEALLMLIDYKYEQIVSLNSERYQPMRRFVEKFLNEKNKLSAVVRAKAAKIIDFLGVYNLLVDMPKNIELKAILRSFDSTVAHTQRFCFGQTPQILKQFVSYFVSHNGRLSLREYLEPESPAHADLLFYEIPEADDDTGLKISEFVKTEILDVKNLKETLQLSMGVRGSLKKTRYLFIHEQVRIHLDRVEDLGDFIEIEVRLYENQNSLDGYRTAEYFMTQLGIPKEDFIEGAYIDKLIESMDDEC